MQVATPPTLQLQCATYMGQAPDIQQPDMSRLPAVCMVAAFLTTSRTRVRAQQAVMVQVGEQPRVGRRLGLTSPDSSDDSEDESAPQGHSVSFQGMKASEQGACSW